MHKFFRFLKKLFNKTFIVLCIVLLIFVAFFYGGWFKKQGDKCIGMYYVYRGDKAYQKGKLQQAIDNYKRGLRLYPEHYEAWFNLGNIYVVYEDYYAAADAYEQSIENNPRFTEARMNLGIVSSEKLGNFNEAISQYQRIIGKKRFFISIPFIFNNKKSEKTNLGLAYYNMGVAYKKKSLYDGNNKNLAAIDLSKAIEAYLEASKILKKDYDVHYNLALAYHMAGDYNDAGINYCKAIKLEPMNYEAHYNLAILLRHMRLYKDAYDQIEKANILVSGSTSNTNTTSYVFDVLNDVSTSIVNSEQYKDITEKIDNEPSGEGITYVHGKVMPTDALDRVMLDNLKKCDVEKLFDKDTDFEE